MGQHKEVTVKRIVVRNTIEDRILKLQLAKQGLADAALGEGGARKNGKMTINDIKMVRPPNAYLKVPAELLLRSRYSICSCARHIIRGFLPLGSVWYRVFSGASIVNGVNSSSHREVHLFSRSQASLFCMIATHRSRNVLSSTKNNVWIVYSTWIVSCCNEGILSLKSCSTLRTTSAKGTSRTDSSWGDRAITMVMEPTIVSASFGQNRGLA
jgi:hypothetical protein